MAWYTPDLERALKRQAEKRAVRRGTSVKKELRRQRRKQS